MRVQPPPSAIFAGAGVQPVALLAIVAPTPLNQTESVQWLNLSKPSANVCITG